MRVYVIAAFSLTLCTQVAKAQNVESLPSLRQALLESYESMEAAKEDFSAAEKKYQAAEQAERANAVELLTKIAEKEISSGDLGEAKKVFTKVLELNPYNKDAEQFFMSTGAGEVRKRIIVDQMKNNALENIRPMDLTRAKTWMAVANDLDPGNREVMSLTNSIESLDDFRQAIVDEKPFSNSFGQMTEWQSTDHIAASGVARSQWLRSRGKQWIELFTDDGKPPVTNRRITEQWRIGNSVGLHDAARKRWYRIHADGILYVRYPHFPDNQWLEVHRGSWIK